MEFFNPHFFVLTLGLVGVVIIIAALLSGLIDRSDLPQVGVFLALGAMLGPAGLGLLDITLESPILRIVAPLNLVLVLFTDAVGLSIAEVRRHGALEGRRLRRFGDIQWALGRTSERAGDALFDVIGDQAPMGGRCLTRPVRGCSREADRNYTPAD